MRIDDPHRRNMALLKWIDRHGREFGGGLAMSGDDEPTNGWGSLEDDVFPWIYETHILQDCWAAIKLYGRLNQTYMLWLQTPAFGTRGAAVIVVCRR